jgi:redox-sensitive bicupin YhaK (pirin superfamily)
MLFGGEKFKTPPYISWNFVTHSKDRMEQAMLRWKNNQFPVIPGNDKEFLHADFD